MSNSCNQVSNISAWPHKEKYLSTELINWSPNISRSKLSEPYAFSNAFTIMPISAGAIVIFIFRIAKLYQRELLQIS